MVGLGWGKNKSFFRNDIRAEGELLPSINGDNDSEKKCAIEFVMFL